MKDNIIQKNSFEFAMKVKILSPHPASSKQVNYRFLIPNS